MENENVIGKVCFAILRKGFVAGLRISLELDSPGCIIGCKFDGAGIVGNTVIDDSDILLHITSHGIQTEKGHTTGDRSVFYIGVGAALKLSVWITSENNRCLIASTADGSLLLYVALLMTMSRHDTIPRSLKAKRAWLLKLTTMKSML